MMNFREGDSRWQVECLEEISASSVISRRDGSAYETTTHGRHHLQVKSGGGLIKALPWDTHTDPEPAHFKMATSSLFSGEPGGNGKKWV